MTQTITEKTTQIDQKFFADILAAIGSEAHIFPVEPESIESAFQTLQQNLNSLINRGIFFSVTPNGFRTLNGGMKLTEKEELFLSSKSSFVLCHLQQMLLSRDIFNHEPHLLEDFRSEVIERESIATDGADDIPLEVHEKSVIETTKRWFADIYAERQTL